MAALDYRPKQVRLFLAILLAIFVLVTLKATSPAGAARWIWLGLEAVILGGFMAVPKLFFPVFRLIMVLSSKLGSLIFLIISTLVFFVILTPMALVLRLFGKKFLLIRQNPKAASYYEDPAPEGGFERQF